MRVPTRRSLAATAAVSLAAGLLAAAPSNATDAAAPRPAGEHYVALGDSFVSGPGIPEQRPELPACARSTKNFVSVVAETIGAASFTDASCSAARTVDWWEPQAGTGAPAQLDALTADTTLVTLGTMGGNDVGLVGLAQACLLQGCSTLPTAPFHEAIDALAPVYRQAIADVRTRSPHAEIVAVGYGTYVPLETCTALINATDADLVYLQGTIDRLSDTIEAVAAEEDIAFVDMRDIQGWRDHTACAEQDEQWVRGLNGFGDGVALHPSTAGMAQMATQSLKVIEPLIAPEPAPKPTSKQRLAAAAKTVDVRAFCHGPRARKRVTVRTTGGKGLVTVASFRVGRLWIGTDRKAPFRVTRKVSSLQRKLARGPVRAKVVLRHGKAARVKTVTTKRPGCLR